MTPVRTLVRLFLGIALPVALVFGFSVAPAAAHADLVESSPSDGATLTVSPEIVTLKFSENLLERGSAVTVRELEADRQVEVDAVQVKGRTLTLTWPVDATSGNFRVAYRTAALDGHVLEGRISFEIQGAASAKPSPEVSMVPAVPALAVTEPVDGSKAPLLWVGGIVAAIVVVVGALGLSRRRGH